VRIGRYHLVLASDAPLRPPPVTVPTTPTERRRLDSLSGSSKVAAIGGVVLLGALGYLSLFAANQFVLRHTPLAAQLALTASFMIPGALGIYVLYCRASGRAPQEQITRIYGSGIQQISGGGCRSRR